MKKFTQSVIYLFIASAMLNSCSKTNLKEGSPDQQAAITLHKYGLLPVTDEEMQHVSLFTPEIFNGGKTGYGLSYSGTLPSSYLLTTPAIRDQGQIGSCTGFCGTEANESVKYYAAGGSSAAQSPI
ncbi:MAG TPA: hypothetical protein VHA52_10425, partial [Candidatus Babeliaceae bacterium]|nr:hypothetical protein [Candidatus Babeliaceae bacterium]